MIDPDDETPAAKRREFWELVNKTGTNVAGGLVGLGTVATTGNPAVGVFVGTFVSKSLEMVCSNLLSTHLAYRERVRIGAAAAVSLSRLQDRVAGGEALRADALVEPGSNGRSDVAEVTEAAMMAAMNSAEERKVEFLGALVTSIAFDATIGTGDAHLMIETARSLSYRSFVILQIASKTEYFKWPTRGREGTPGPPGRLYPLMSETYELTRRGLVEMKESRDSENLDAIFGADDIDPSRLFLTPFGHALHKSLELNRIPESDNLLKHTAAELGELATFGRGAPKASNSTAVWG